MRGSRCVAPTVPRCAFDLYSGADFLAAYWPLRRMGYVDPNE